MFCTLINKVQSLSLRTHIVTTLASFAAFQLTRINLDKLYAASRHPVDFATGQLAFNGDTIYGYYQSMRAAGTFDIYVYTQLFDFAFIASVIVFGLCFGALIGRFGAAKSLPRRMGIGAAFFAFAGGTLDALENLMSFWLMQFDDAIPNVLAMIYSSFAALKFASLTAAMALAFAALLIGLLMKATHYLRRTSAA